MTRQPRLSLQSLEDRAVPAAAGSLDPSFGEGGIVAAALPELPSFSSRFLGSSETLLKDGSRVVFSQINVIDFSYLAHLLISRNRPDGSLDTSFGTNGSTFTLYGSPPVSSAVAIDSANRIVFLHKESVVRLTADGRFDPTFGTEGSNPGTAGRVSVPFKPVLIAAQPDGRIIVAGVAPKDSGASIAVSRLNVDGTVDAGFGTNGIRYLSVPTAGFNAAIAESMAVLPDGRIVIGVGTVVESYSSQNAGNHRWYTVNLYDGAVIRLEANGTQDLAFGNSGIFQYETPSESDTVVQLQPLSDGGLFVGISGISGYNRFTFLRLDSSGAIDANYNGGRAILAAGKAAVAIDGTVVVSETTTDGLSLKRYTKGGTLDTRFRTEPFAGLSAFDAIFQGTGDLLLSGGQQVDPATSRGVLFRVLGESAPYPTPLGTIAVGGAKDGTFTALQPNASGTTDVIFPQNLYPGFTGDVRTATADVNGDGTADYVSGPGVLGGPNVVITDGKSGKRIADLNAFETVFTGGVFVAAADLNGDGFADVVVTPDQGGGPVVVIYDGAKLAAGLNEDAQLVRFFGISDTAFRGGARPALGDVDGDGKPDLIVAAGFGGGPRVAVFDGRTVLDPSTYRPEVLEIITLPAKPFVSQILSDPLPPKLMGDFFVFEQGLRNGVYITAGDLNDDGRAEIVVGGGPGGGPRVMALDGKALLGGTMTPVLNFFAGDVESRGGIRVAVKPAADGTPRVVTGSGEGQLARVNFFTANGAAAGSVSPYGDIVLPGGVYVG